MNTAACLPSRIRTKDISLVWQRTGPESSYLVQRISVLIQRYNAVLLHQATHVYVGRLLTDVGSGLHGLSCRRSSPRQQRHSHLNDILWRAILLNGHRSRQSRNQLLAVSLMLNDNRRLDGTTPFPAGEEGNPWHRRQTRLPTCGLLPEHHDLTDYCPAGL